MAAMKDNALREWQSIETMLCGKNVVLFSDYDGTLTPIVDRPERAYLSDDMRATLNVASSTFVTAIVTGRSREKVHEFVQLDSIFYAGSHGFDIHGPSPSGSGSGSGSVSHPLATDNHNTADHPPSQVEQKVAKPPEPLKHAVAAHVRPALDQATTELGEQLGHVPGFEIEDNKFSISVHYRNVPSERHAQVLDGVHAYMNKKATSDDSPQSLLTLKPGKMVIELRPNMNWNKGFAVLWILEALGLDKRSDIFPIYLGDDVSDEDAFIALQSRPRNQRTTVTVSSSTNHPVTGLGILVREANDTERSPETSARFSLRNPEEVRIFIRKLIQYQTQQGKCGEGVAAAAAVAADLEASAESLVSEMEHHGVASAALF